jgi:hypothetical protein
MRRIGNLTARRAAALALALSLGGAGAAQGQTPGLREVRTWGGVGLGLVVGLPVGEFRSYVGPAPGVAGSFAVNLDRAGAVALRVDGAYIQYGNEDRPVSLAGTGGLVNLDMNTDFFIASLRAGPQLVLGQGPVRMYGFGTVGAAYFATWTSLRDNCGCYDIATTTNYGDGALSLAGGGGFLMDVSRGHHPVSLDVGAMYVRNGRVTYLREGSIVANPDGSFTLQPVRSVANLVVLQLGVSIGLR